MNNDEYFDANRRLWNTRATLHVSSDFYNVPRFKSGESSLCGIELQEMGSVEGKSILHLQCHFGLDTLSLSRAGGLVTGVDFSEKSIDIARSLADELDLQATFVCCNVLDLREHLSEAFDIVFTSFGVLGWLPDLDRWASVIRHFLKPGGFVYLLEFHRFFIQFDEDGMLAYNYFSTERPDEETTSSTYADNVSHEPMTEYWWNHSMSDLFSALWRAGLHVTQFREFPFSAYRLYEKMTETTPGHWVHTDLQARIPYMFSLQAYNSAPHLTNS